MKCIDKNILLDYLNDELSSRKKKHIASHLSECGHCRRELEKWKKILDITQEFVDQDVKLNPVPPHAHITQRFSKLPHNDESSFWVRYWVKPAIATASLIFIALMVFFFSPKTVPELTENYYVIDNVTYTETISLEDRYLDNLETLYLQEIYENEELTYDILYGDWQNYEEVLNDLDHDELEELINKMYDNEIT